MSFPAENTYRHAARRAGGARPRRDRCHHRRAYDDSAKTFPKYELWRGIKIHRVFNTGFGSGAKWRRAADFLTLLNFVLRAINFVAEAGCSGCADVAAAGVGIVAAFAKLRGAKFCSLIMDLNPDEAIAAGWLSPDSFAANWLERLSRFSLRRAAKVVVLDKFMHSGFWREKFPPIKSGHPAVVAPFGG